MGEKGTAIFRLSTDSKVCTLLHASSKAEKLVATVSIGEGGSGGITDAAAFGVCQNKTRINLFVKSQCFYYLISLFFATDSKKEEKKMQKEKEMSR